MVHCLDIRCADEDGELCFNYGVAGVTLRCQFPIPPLSVFQLPSVHQRSQATAPIRRDNHSDGEEKRANGWVAGAWRDVTLTSRERGFRMSVPGVACFNIDATGTLISVEEPLVATGSDVFYETLLGPALVFVLALRGIWCMHAAAVRVDSGVLMFVGESGAGKSTLARFLAENRVCEERIADDILPVGGVRGNLVCLPRFPQLGLTADAHCLDSETVPISAVYELSRTDDGIGIEQYDPSRAALVWVRHTVAARLFPGEILQAQFQFAADALGVPVFGVSYPHRRQSLTWFTRHVADHGPVAA